MEWTRLQRAMRCDLGRSGGGVDGGVVALWQDGAGSSLVAPRSGSLANGREVAMGNGPIYAAFLIVVSLA